MSQKFTIEEHEKRMREILNPKPKLDNKRLFDNLLKKASEKRKARLPELRRSGEQAKLPKVGL